MQNQNKTISKLISYWLRHHPADANLVLDKYGWTSLSAVLHALAIRRLGISVETLKILNISSDKIRFEIDEPNDRIRATHGHSVTVQHDDKINIPPPILHSRIGAYTLARVRKQGLVTRRQFVHLTEQIDALTQKLVRSGKLIVLPIETAPLVDAGWVFYNTSPNIWLTTHIPPVYLPFD